METIRKETYKKLEDGTMELVSVENIEIETPSPEQLIADKEAQLLKIYTELEALKNNNQ